MNKLLVITYKGNYLNKNGEYESGNIRIIAEKLKDTSSTISVKLANGEKLKISKKNIVKMEEMSCFK